MAKWFKMPEGIDSISIQQLEFHPRVVEGGVRLMVVPDHLAPEVLNLRFGTARFMETNRPDGVDIEEETAASMLEDSVAKNGQILNLQVQVEGLRAQIAELSVERDTLRLRAAELESRLAEHESELEVPKIKEKKGKLTDAPPAELLLDQMAGMTFGKD